MTATQIQLLAYIEARIGDLESQLKHIGAECPIARKIRERNPP